MYMLHFLKYVRNIDHQNEQRGWVPLVYKIQIKNILLILDQITDMIWCLPDFEAKSIQCLEDQWYEVENLEITDFDTKILISWIKISHLCSEGEMGLQL